MKNEHIMLSGRKYKIRDIGEGPACLLLIHQDCQLPVSLSMLIEQIRDDYRLIILDLTEHFPAEVDSISELKLNLLIDDLHLLCDIYWLKKVIVHSDYQPDVIQSKFKEQLFERYQPDLDICQAELDLH